MKHAIAPILLLIALRSHTAVACTRTNDLPTPQALVARASAIVVATASRYAIEPVPRGYGRVEFHVERVLRGADLLPAGGRAPLLVEGLLSDRNDFNDHPSPYDFVRREGRAGSCFARTYREGARFLLLLAPDRDGSLTPYWEALAPTNEQLHPGDDPWLTAVRGFATSPKPR